MSSHLGISCDVCLKTNFSNRCYKCLICDNYDLCGLCYDINAESQYHKHTHPMQCILTKTAHEFFYSGESIPYRTIVSLTCPYCSINKTGRMCPICVINQSEGHQIRYLSLVDHITKEHDPDIAYQSQTKINDILEDDDEDEGLPLYILAERLFLKEETRRQSLIRNEISSQRRLLARQTGSRGARGNLRGHPYEVIPRRTLRAFRIPFDPYASILFDQDPLFDYDAPFCLTSSHIPSVEPITNEQKKSDIVNSKLDCQQSVSIPESFITDDQSFPENPSNDPRSLLGKIVKTNKTMKKLPNEQDRILFLQSLFLSLLNLRINNE